MIKMKNGKNEILQGHLWRIIGDGQIFSVVQGLFNGKKLLIQEKLIKGHRLVICLHVIQLREKRKR